MSRRRHLEPFRKYSDRPSRDTRRLTEISLNLTNSPGALPSVLSNTSSMVACPTGLRALEPLKITSVMDSPRRYFAELSPITQRTASMMLDLPQPFGPTTAVMFDGNGTVVGSTKDLKPASLMDLSRISGVLLRENAQHLLPLVFTEILHDFLQAGGVSGYGGVCQVAEENPGFGNFAAKVVECHVVGTADGRPEVFQGFFQERVFNQAVGVAHHAETGIDHLLGGIWRVRIESVDHRLHLPNLAHHSAKFRAGPALKHFTPKHAQQVDVDVVQGIYRSGGQVGNDGAPAWIDFHQVPALQNQQCLPYRATADI